jgi:hypothetical protein
MATTPHPDRRPATDPPAPDAPVEEVWETVRPIHPGSRFQAVRLATVPPLARSLTRPAPSERTVKEIRS